jgi:hypothetical protein
VVSGEEITKQFWKEGIKGPLLEKFEFALTPEELDPTYSLKLHAHDLIKVNLSQQSQHNQLTLKA